MSLFYSTGLHFLKPGAYITHSAILQLNDTGK